MIVSIEGLIEHVGSDSAIVKVGPLGLQIFIPGSTLLKLGIIGNRIYLHTHLHWKEDSIAVYGFASAEDLKLFKYLLSVSGIGPRVALNILSNLDTEQVVSAVMSGNGDLLSQVPGVGKKTAARIILELKGKLEKDWKEIIVPVAGRSNAEVVEVLTELGYSLREATQVVSMLPDSQNMELEEKVRLALKQLATM